MIAHFMARCDILDVCLRCLRANRTVGYRRDRNHVLVQCHSLLLCKGAASYHESRRIGDSGTQENRTSRWTDQLIRLVVDANMRLDAHILLPGWRLLGCRSSRRSAKT
jgi:hypothetical protein